MESFETEYLIGIALVLMLLILFFYFFPLGLGFRPFFIGMGKGEDLDSIKNNEKKQKIFTYL